MGSRLRYKGMSVVLDHTGVAMKSGLEFNGSNIHSCQKISKEVGRRVRMLKMFCCILHWVDFQLFVPFTWKPIF